MQDATALRQIVNDPLSSVEEREQAQRELDALESDDGVAHGESAERDTLSADAQAMLAALGMKPLALFAVSGEQFERYCRKHGISGERYDTLSGEWQQYRLPSDELLRTLHLADPSTPTEWAWLCHWRGMLANAKKRLVRQFAERSIQMLAEYDAIPADVRKTASRFLAEYREGQPVPAIDVPGKERWATIPHDDLYERMERVRELRAE